MRVPLAAVLACLVVATPALAGESEVLLEEQGRLLAGTAGVGVGAPGEAVPGEAPLSPGPVSHAAHPFAVDCARGLAATVQWTSLANATLGAPEHALVQVELRTADGTVLASTFDDDGRAVLGTDGQVAPGTYELHLFHVAGEPVGYEAVVEGVGSLSC